MTSVPARPAAAPLVAGESWSSIAQSSSLRQALMSAAREEPWRCIATRERRSHCRPNADETRTHSTTLPSTRQHNGLPEPWTVQHYRARPTTAQHSFGGFPKPGAARSSRAGGTTFLLLMALSPGREPSQKPETGRNADILPPRRVVTAAYGITRDGTGSGGGCEERRHSGRDPETVPGCAWRLRRTDAQHRNISETSH